MNMHLRNLHPARSMLRRLGQRARSFIAHCAMLSIVVSPILHSPAYATIADSPLYLTSAVEPNIMFVLDDSGSMHWEMLPDDSVYSLFVFPRASEVYHSSDNYSNYVPTFVDGFVYSARLRSAQINPLYYNPAITYRRWANADGSLMPNADPAAAYHNPHKTSAGTRNLTANNTQAAGWDSCTAAPPTGCTYVSESRTFYPAVYFTLTGVDPWAWASYTKTEIRSTTLSYTGEGRTSRTDCISGTCTYAQEIQNFANWYTYYRSRVLAARAGIGHAFATQSTNMRVGFGAINQGSITVDNVSTSTIISGVRSFSGTDRTTFFNNLYTHPIPVSNTPLRHALDDVGQYYSRSDNRGPWGNTPGTNDGVAINTHVQCRQSYTILMTDGYWNGDEASTNAARLNVDGTDGPSHTGPGNASFTYSAVSPFSDSHSDTLADVAMYYWKNDLRTDLDNAVPVSTINPAFWQHMSTFGVGLGVTGSVNPTTAFNAIGTGAAITWPDPTSSNAAKLDDLLHASVNGRGGFFSAADPTTFATELSDVLTTITSRISSAAAVASNSTRLTSSTHLYQALFNSGDWSGNLKAFPLQSNGTIGTMAWDAADHIPAHGSRNIMTWSGSAGMAFSGAVGTLTTNQVNYLRGDDSLEIQYSTGPSDALHVFRNRSTRLGDIINSDPHFVYSENFGYNVLPSTPGTDYPAFLAGKSSRRAMVYVGANDGMLHGFDASFVCQDTDPLVDSDGDGDLTNDCDIKVPASTAGDELLAYVPQAVWPNLPLLTSTTYTHKYFVDGSPTSWDAYWGASWKTVLVGGLGAGGKAVYALDVSTPTSFGTSNVLWEFTGSPGTQTDNMGHVMGNVTVARMKDGNFWAVFGNGFGSTSGKSVLFMVQVDSPSTVKMIELGAGTGNGLAQPTLVDEDGDRIIDLIYAGDLKGNVWKVDVTGNTTSTWKSAYLQGATPKPLFTAKDGSGNAQPITSGIEVGRAPSGASGLMVYFGTGKYFEVGDNATLGTQTMYGVVDNGSDDSLLRSTLQPQSIIYEGTVSGNRVRAVSANTVDYATQDGWYIDLLTPPSTQKGERMISAPMLFGGRLILQTVVPSLSPCDYGGASWLMQVDPATGGQLLAPAFINLGITTINVGGGVMAPVSGLDSGVGLSGGFGVPIQAGDKAYVPLTGTAGTLGATGISSGSIKPRASWRQIQ
jgi:type IV pilus assembly protein PilY1